MTYGDANQGDGTQLNTVGGDLLVLLSGLCYAAYTVSRQYLCKYQCLHALSARANTNAWHAAPSSSGSLIAMQATALIHHWNIPYGGKIHSLINMAALQIAIRKMLHEDDSMSMMLFFGFVGALNAVCLAPVLLTLHLAGFVSAAGLTLRVFALTVCKGTIPLPAPASCLP